jgi:hypothetical protein
MKYASVGDHKHGSVHWKMLLLYKQGGYSAELNG